MDISINSKKLNADGARASKASRILLIDKRFGLIDFGLLVVTLLLIFTEAKILAFHLTFFLLTFGAFYWGFGAFIWRAVVWVTLTTTSVIFFIQTHAVHGEELIEIPLLTGILVLVFIIARQRSNAEMALWRVNEELETRVTSRTTQLSEANADLQKEIAKRIQIEKTLRESEERYRRLVELSFETVVVLNQQEILYVNSSGIKLLGAESEADIVGRSVLDFVHPEDRDAVQSRIQTFLETGQDLPPTEQKLMKIDGRQVVVELAAIPISYQSQPAIQTIIRDISQRKEAEAAQEQERLRIARDLHDSLGQSLGYLHLKLDALASMEEIHEQVGLKGELARMRDEANAAYEIVRGMLASTLTNNTSKLSTVLRDLAKLVGTQHGFGVQLISHGQARSLSPLVQQQVLFLFRETMANVAKHADARQVQIALLWTEQVLTIVIVDDGCGFHPEVPIDDGRFGLAIMQQRAEQINGTLSIRSALNKGTEVTVQIPLPDQG